MAARTSASSAWRREVCSPRATRRSRKPTSSAARRAPPRGRGGRAGRPCSSCRRAGRPPSARGRAPGARAPPRGRARARSASRSSSRTRPARGRPRRRRRRRAGPGPPGSRSRATVPGAGAKPASASSAHSRTSIAWPAKPAAARRGGGRRAPRATCSFTRSSPVVTSETAVLDLEPRVGLEEPEVLAGRVVQELDGRRADVARRPDEAHRRLPQRRLARRGQPGHRRLLDQLLVPPLDRRLARGQRPHPAPRVGYDLHVDVADAVEPPLQEHRGLAEPLPAPPPARP